MASSILLWVMPLRPHCPPCVHSPHLLIHKLWHRDFPFLRAWARTYTVHQKHVIIWKVDVWHDCTLFVFQIFSLVWAAEAASSWTSAAATATPADPHLAELHPCNDPHSTTLIHRRSSTAVRMQQTKETVPDPRNEMCRMCFASCRAGDP